MPETAFWRGSQLMLIRYARRPLGRSVNAIRLPSGVEVGKLQTLDIVAHIVINRWYEVDILEVMTIPLPRTEIFNVHSATRCKALQSNLDAHTRRRGSPDLSNLHGEERRWRTNGKRLYSSRPACHSSKDRCPLSCRYCFCRTSSNGRSLLIKFRGTVSRTRLGIDPHPLVTRLRTGKKQVRRSRYDATLYLYSRLP